MVRVQQHDFPAEHAAAKIGDRHLDGLNAAGAAIVGINAGHVIEVADHDVAARADRWPRGSRRRSAAARQAAEILSFITTP